MKVRIQRKRKSTAQMFLGWMNIFTLLTGILLRPYITRGKEQAQALKNEELATRITANRERAKQAANNVVLGDIRIEKELLALQIMQAKAKSLGIGTNEFAPPSDYESEHRQ